MHFPGINEGRAKLVDDSGGSRPSDKGGRGWGGHSDPEIMGGGRRLVWKKDFSVLQDSFWSKITEGPGPFGPLLWKCHSNAEHRKRKVAKGL